MEAVNYIQYPLLLVENTITANKISSTLIKTFKFLYLSLIIFMKTNGDPYILSPHSTNNVVIFSQSRNDSTFFIFSFIFLENFGKNFPIKLENDVIHLRLV